MQNKHSASKELRVNMSKGDMIILLLNNHMQYTILGKTLMHDMVLTAIAPIPPPPRLRK